MRKIVSQKKFNTNNAWGFGGGIGVETTYSDGTRKRKGTAYFRHSTSRKFLSYFDADGAHISEKQWRAGRCGPLVKS